jgi:RNA polymerase sigma-70 factor (ECF subfamily)
MDDDELIAAIGSGDGDDTALRELFSRHAPWLAARLRKALPPDDVEDVLQETFIAVWQNAKTYQPRGTPAAWLWVIARNQAAMLLRKRGQPPVPLPGEGTGETEETGPGADPADAVLARAELAAATQALNGADRRAEREVWQLLYVEDRPVAEVAQLTGVPEGTVKSRAHRARRLLRAALGSGTHGAEGGTR